MRLLALPPCTCTRIAYQLDGGPSCLLSVIPMLAFYFLCSLLFLFFVLLALFVLRWYFVAFVVAFVLLLCFVVAFPGL